ncbi:hypothetical protein V5799_025872, partial [Amblyomma americanum]
FLLRFLTVRSSNAPHILAEENHWRSSVIERMEDDTPQLGAQYSSTQALVQLIDIADGATTASQLREQRTSQRRRSMALGMMKILLLLSLIVAGPVITFLLLRPCEKVSPYGEKNAYFGLPEVVNLRLVSAADDFFTVTWERPDGDFDHYWIGVAGDSGESLDANETHRVGSCVRGTILHADQTRVTCSHIETCTMVNFTVRTYKNGPPQLASSGATLQSILIPGKGPYPPKNINLLRISSTQTRLQWEPAAKVHGSLASYAVKVCGEFSPCDVAQDLSNCTDYETTGTSLVVDSISNSSYCIAVTTVEVCGERVTASPPAAAELKAPFTGPQPPYDIKIHRISPTQTRLQWKPPAKVSGRLGSYAVKICDMFASCDAEQYTSYTTAPQNFTLENLAVTTTPYAPEDPHKALFSSLKRPSTLRVSANGEKNAYFGLPEGVNLRLVSAADDFFTVTWERPDGDFDHYWIGVAGDSGESLDADETHRVGSCVRGTILHPDQTRVTCSHIETCTMVNFTVRTYKNGPPQIASSGATLQSILIPGKAQYLSNCTDYETTGSSIVVDSIYNSSYSIVVTTFQVFGQRLTASLPATAELKAPFRGSCHATQRNLSLVAQATRQQSRGLSSTA